MKAPCWFLCLKKSAITFGEGCSYTFLKRRIWTKGYHQRISLGSICVIIKSFIMLEPLSRGIWWCSSQKAVRFHDDVTQWKHFPRYLPFVRGIHRWPLNSPHKGQWRGALMSSMIWAWMNGWVNIREAGDLRHHRTHYDVTVMLCNKASRALDFLSQMASFWM